MTDDKKKKEFYDLLDRFFDLDKRSDELKLFVAGHALNVNSWFNRRASANDLKRTLDPWLERFVQWEDHINAYHELEGGRYGTKRIDKLSKHLDVLDTKIGIALNFNSLLVAGVSLFAPWITNFGLSLCSSGRWVFEIFVVLVFVVLGLLVWNLGILLRGFRRVVWGRLGSATLLALVPPLVFRADVASPRPCPKCPMVEAMKAEKIEAFPLDEIDDLGDGSRPEDKVIEPRKLQKLKGDLREKSAKAGDILLLLGSADCVATKKGGLWRNNEDLAKARADWVNHSLGGQEEVKDIKIKSLPLPQHARCGPARNVRAVFPFLIHPENN